MNKKNTEYKDINKFLSSFTIVEHSEGSTILTSQNNTYLVRNIEISSQNENEKQQELNEIITTLSSHQSLNCKNILPLINFDIFFNKNKTETQIRAIYHHGRKSLSTEIEERKLSDEAFDEDALWSLLYSLVTPLVYLEQKSIIYGVLDTTRIFLDNDVIAIMDPSSTGIDPYEITTNRLYSPELIQAEENFEQINMFKSDVFVLGLLMLQCTLLKMELYDFDENILEICFTEIKDLYSETFCQLIESMLNFEPEERPSFEQILEQVNEIFEIYTNENCQLEPTMPDEEDEPNQICEMEEYNEREDIDILETEYIRFEDNHQNMSSIEIENGKMKFYDENSQLSQSPINESSEFSENSSLFIEESLVKSFEKSKRFYKPKDIKERLIKNGSEEQFSSFHNETVRVDSYHNKENAIHSHRRTKTSFDPNLEQTCFNENTSKDQKGKELKENQSQNHKFESGVVFSPLNKENLFTKPEIMNMIKTDMKRIEERKKKFLNVNFTSASDNNSKSLHYVVKNEQREQKVANTNEKVQSFHQASMNSNRR